MIQLYTGVLLALFRNIPSGVMCKRRGIDVAWTIFPMCEPDVVWCMCSGFRKHCRPRDHVILPFLARSHKHLSASVLVARGLQFKNRKHATVVFSYAGVPLPTGYWCQDWCAWTAAGLKGNAMP
jgi:hypothetical protein